MNKLFALLLAMILPMAAAAQNTMGDTSMKKEIYLAGGCFWGIERLMSLVPGVLEAESGYANGTAKNPTYREVCAGDTGHRETVRVAYDPAKISLDKLLTLYFSVIDPTQFNRQGNDAGTQYQAGIYWTDEETEQIVRREAEKEKKRHAEFFVELTPLTAFYPAEDYHQDYLEKNPGGYCHVPLGAFEKAKTLDKPAEKPAPEYRRITAEEARKLKLQNHSAMIVDVRTPDEFAAGHIHDAVNIPLDMLEDVHETEIPSKNDLLLVYCRSGARSRTAASLLVSLGYTNVYDFGGIIDWPYQIEK